MPIRTNTKEAADVYSMFPGSSSNFRNLSNKIVIGSTSSFSWIQANKCNPYLLLIHKCKMLFSHDTYI